MRWNYLVLIDEHVFPITKILNPRESALSLFDESQLDSTFSGSLSPDLIAENQNNGHLSILVFVSSLTRRRGRRERGRQSNGIQPLPGIRETF